MTIRNEKESGERRNDSPSQILLDTGRVSLATLTPALRGPVALTLSADDWKRIEQSAARVHSIVARGEPAYGINTGFGSLCRTRIPEDQLAQLQHNLIVSHAVGVGPLAPAEIVRLMMILKLVSLSKGASGVSRTTVERLLNLVSADILPEIPTQGSLGASGDLAPLAHMVLPMLGLGFVRVGGKRVSAEQALKRQKLKPTQLGPKEGLALINGTQFMTAYAVAIASRARQLVKHADLIAAVSLEGAAGSLRPFDERLQSLRPHRGAIESATNVRNLLSGSEILESHANCDRVQDPYSLRCVPQVHGASRDALRHAIGVIETEINAVTDNPIITDDGDVISGGLFHGQPIAFILDYLALALSEIASISERRTYLLLDGRDGLPRQLIEESGVNSGLMILQYVAAALVSENKGLTAPASADSIPSSMGQEDHVSMGGRSATKCYQVLANTEKVLAIEQICAAQALDFRAPLKPGNGVRIAHETLRQHIAHASEDRMFGEDIAVSSELISNDLLLESVEASVGMLQ